MQSHEHGGVEKRLYNCGRAYCKYCRSVRASRHCQYRTSDRVAFTFCTGTEYWIGMAAIESDRLKRIHRVQNECSIWHFYGARRSILTRQEHTVALPTLVILCASM